MTTTKHTPGPWRMGSQGSRDAVTGRPFRCVYRGDDESVATRLYVRGGEGANGRVFDCDADARLIAAAPTMYDALVAYLEDDGLADGVETGLAEAAKAAGWVPPPSPGIVIDTRTPEERERDEQSAREELARWHNVLSEYGVVSLHENALPRRRPVGEHR